MLPKTMIDDCKILFQLYIPNLLSLFSENEFKIFLEKSYNFTVLYYGKTANTNFLATFLMLVREVAGNKSNKIRNEWGYFNYLLGEFTKIENNKQFKNLVSSVINNYEKNDFKNVLGEIAVCLRLSAKYQLLKYEKVLENGKNIDFEFKDKKGEIFLIEVLNIEYDSTRYEGGKTFEKFICGRLEKKFNEKSLDLDDHYKRRILIFPIIHGFTIDIFRENELFLTTLNKSRFPENEFNSFNPMSFAKVQDTFFDLFTVEEIAVGKLQR
jgi:hypothetical protein